MWVCRLVTPPDGQTLGRPPLPTVGAAGWCRPGRCARRAAFTLANAPCRRSRNSSGVPPLPIVLDAVSFGRPGQDLRAAVANRGLEGNSPGRRVEITSEPPLDDRLRFALARPGQDFAFAAAQPGGTATGNAATS